MKLPTAAKILLIGVTIISMASAFTPPSTNFAYPRGAGGVRQQQPQQQQPMNIPGHPLPMPMPMPVQQPFFAANTRLGSSSSAEEDVIQYPSPKLNAAEKARPYRRTVYTHEDWMRHRSTDRFYRNLSTAIDSAVVGNVATETLTVTAFATFLVFWNAISGDYQGIFNGIVGMTTSVSAGVANPGPLKDVLPMLTLPLTIFTIASPSLGILLAFRVKNAYSRWDEARKNWGMNINHTRDLVRMGSAYYDRSAVHPDDAKEDLERLALCTWAFVRSMKRHLSPEWEDEADFRKELLEKLPREQAEGILNAAHRPNRALQDLSVAIENLPMHPVRRNEIHKAATIFEDNLGSSERLLTSPIPLFYSKVTSRALGIFLLALPLGLYDVFDSAWNHLPIIPVSFFVSLFLFGIEELATQLEEPFTILPMQGFCDKIYNWCNEIVSFEPGDNGMPVYNYDNTRLNTGPGGTPMLVKVPDQDTSTSTGRSATVPSPASSSSSEFPPASMSMPSSNLSPSISTTSTSSTTSSAMDQYTQQLSQSLASEVAAVPAAAPTPAASAVPQPVATDVPSTLSPYEQYLQSRNSQSESLVSEAAAVPATVPAPVPAPSPAVSEVPQPVVADVPSTLSPYEQYLQSRDSQTLPQDYKQQYSNNLHSSGSGVVTSSSSSTFQFNQASTSPSPSSAPAPAPVPVPVPSPAASEVPQPAAADVPSTLSPYEQYMQSRNSPSLTSEVAAVPAMATVPAPSPVASETTQPVASSATSTLSPYEQYIQSRDSQNLTSGRSGVPAPVPVPIPSPVPSEVLEPITSSVTSTLSPYEQYMQSRDSLMSTTTSSMDSSVPASTPTPTVQQPSMPQISTSSTSSSSLDVSTTQNWESTPSWTTSQDLSSSSSSSSWDSSSSQSGDSWATTPSWSSTAQEEASVPQTISTSSTSSSSLNVSGYGASSGSTPVTTTFQTTQTQPTMTMSEYTQSLRRPN